MIQAFRREDSPFFTAQFKLRGMDPSAHYVVKNLDTEQELEFTGKQLMEEGLPVSIHDRPGAVILMYKKTA
jgi:alpha-galactosidase